MQHTGITPFEGLTPTIVFWPQAKLQGGNTVPSIKRKLYYRFTKHGSLCLENPMNRIKRQKERTLKDELPRSVGVPYATGEEWRNNSRKNEETEPKQKHHQAVDVTGDGNKV